MTWLELNSVESREPLSNIFNRLPLVGKRIYLSNVKFYYANIHPLLYGLYRYAGKYFISIVVDKHRNDVELNIISSDNEPISKAVDMLLAKQIQPDKEEELQSNEINKLITTKKYALLDFYFKLSLRNYLHKMNYQPKIMGRRTLWSKESDDTLYSLDADLDPNTLKGYVSVDIRIPSSTTLWDKIISGDININELWELIDTSVMVPYGDRCAYGKIHGFISKKVSETLTLEGKQLNLIDYYTRKGILLDPEEYPIVEVEIISPEPRGSSTLYYPPSQVRIFLPTEKPEPHTRYDKIDGVLENLIKHFNVQGISFRKAVISYKHKKYVNMIKSIVLKYYDRETYASPLFSMQKLNAKPLHGSINIPKLLVLLPKSILAKENSEETINIINKFIQLVYRDYNLGIINKVIVHYYEVHDNPNEQKVEFSNKLKKLLEENTPTEALIMPVINRRYLFKLAKQLCSDKFFHARVIEEETFDNIMELVTELGITNEKKIKYYLNIVKKGKIEDDQLEQLISIISNIVFSIYVEFILQSEIYNHKVPNKLTWALANPADNVGESLYVGYDVSRSTLNRNEVAVAFVLYDSYGYMLNATFKQVRGEKISRDVLESILLSLFKPLTRKQSINRLVIYKDGGIRSRNEFKDIMDTFSKIGKKLGFKQIDVVGVIKRHNLRLFAKRKTENIMDNPKIGIWIKIWDIIRHGVYAERALIVSSEAKAGGTVKPVLIERYSKETSNKTIDEIVNEYLRLCRLDYWNPINGINKFPLPVFMADKLAYLALQGVQIKTP